MQVWVGDTTYLLLVGGRWCYLASWRDNLFAARSGLAPRPAHYPPSWRQGLIIHADRGSQYTGLACRTRIAKAQALASFSRPGNPHSNAQAEAGCSTMKTELLPRGGAFVNLEEAR